MELELAPRVFLRGSFFELHKVEASFGLLLLGYPVIRIGIVMEQCV